MGNASIVGALSLSTNQLFIQDFPQECIIRKRNQNGFPERSNQILPVCAFHTSWINLQAKKWEIRDYRMNSTEIHSLKAPKDGNLSTSCLGRDATFDLFISAEEAQVKIYRKRENCHVHDSCNIHEWRWLPSAEQKQEREETRQI